MADDPKTDAAKADPAQGSGAAKAKEPAGVIALRTIAKKIPTTTPDVHNLFAVMGSYFTVGDLRSLFPGVGDERDEA